MAVRQFGGTSADQLIRTVGTSLSGTTYGCFAAIISPNFAPVGDERTWFSFTTSGNVHRVALYNGGNHQQWWTTVERSLTNVFPTSNIWYLIVVRKTTGTTAIRVSVYNFNTSAWSHANMNSTIANFTSPGAGGTIRFAYFDGGNQIGFYEGLVAVEGAWSNNIKWTADATGDTQLQNAGLQTSYTNWVTQAPTSLWRFDQAAVTDPVNDQIGDAHQSSRTGTTVVVGSDPPGFSFGGLPNTGTSALVAGIQLQATGSAPPVPPATGTSAIQTGVALAAAGSIAHTGSGAYQTGVALASAGSRGSDGSSALATGVELAATGSAAHAGTASLAVGTQLQASGSTPQVGSAALQAGVALEATGSALHTGSAAFVVGVRLRAVGADARVGFSAFEVGMGLAAAGSTIHTGSAAFGVGAELGVAGSTTHTGSAAFGVGVRLAALGGDVHVGSSAFATGVQFAAAGSVAHTGSGALGVGVGLGATGSTPHVGSAAFAVGVGLAADGNQPDVGSASFGIGTQLVAVGSTTHTGSAAFTVGIRLRAVGQGAGVGPITSLTGTVDSLGLDGDVSVRALTGTIG